MVSEICKKSPTAQDSYKINIKYSETAAKRLPSCLCLHEQHMIAEARDWLQHHKTHGYDVIHGEQAGNTGAVATLEPWQLHK